VDVEATRCRRCGATFYTASPQSLIEDERGCLRCGGKLELLPDAPDDQGGSDPAPGEGEDPA
jgi:predicted  nucleic acid-binding Zn-ribbon protein